MRFNANAHAGIMQALATVCRKGVNLELVSVKCMDFFLAVIYLFFLANAGRKDDGH